MNEPITEQRRPRLDLPQRLDDPAELLGILRKIGFSLVSAPTVEKKLAAGFSLAASTGQRFSEARISAALNKFEVANTDRIAIKLALYRQGLLGTGRV
jgi:hypothetical protein